MTELPDDTSIQPNQMNPNDEPIPPGAEEAVAEGLTGDDSIPLELRIQGSEDPNRDPAQTDNWGAFTFEPEPGQPMAPPEAFSNPSGASRGDCDKTDEAGHAEAGQPEGIADCELETTAGIDDFASQETKPGVGIPGYEGEESGGA